MDEKRQLELAQTLLFIDFKESVSQKKIFASLKPFISQDNIKYSNLDESKAWIRLLGCSEEQVKKIIKEIKTNYTIMTYEEQRKCYGMGLPPFW
ncbi:hypothetical protein ABK040_011726 [Willaertia magna]